MRAAWLVAVILLASCAHAPLDSVRCVDLTRYAGNWYVLAHLPAKNERDAYDAIEHYEIEGDRIRIRYTFREGAHDGPEKTLTMRGRVVRGSDGARWHVRPFWPLSLDYVIVDLDDAYEVVVVAHPSRDYAWIMARTPSISEASLGRAIEALWAQGFDVDSLRRVPQSLPPAPVGTSMRTHRREDAWSTHDGTLMLRSAW